MVDVELPGGETARAVLTLVAIAQHQVLARETHDRATRALIATQVKHPRDTEHAADDGEPFVVQWVHRFATPRREVEQLSVFVHRERGAAEQHHEGAPRGGDLDRLKVPVYQEHGLVERLASRDLQPELPGSLVENVVVEGR